MLWVWGLGVSAVVMTFAVGHWYTLPTPDVDNPRLLSAIDRLAAEQPGAAFVAMHVMYADCRCSQRIVEHLLERGARPGGTETIVLVGALPEFEVQALERGFRIEHTQPEGLLSDYGVEAAPLLVVADGERRIRYLGGYTERKQGLDVHDEEILARVEHGEWAAIRALPLFGCAVSQSLQELLDPLRVKYASKAQE